MDCPACREVLIALEYEEVEVDYCAACHGVWLDAGELDLLFGDRTMTDGFLRAGDKTAAVHEKPRPCPICRAKMAKHTTGGEAPVTYDECPQGHGMWFDAGELQTILKHGSALPGGDKVAAWLRDVFGQETAAGE